MTASTAKKQNISDLSKNWEPVTTNLAHNGQAVVIEVHPSKESQKSLSKKDYAELKAAMALSISRATKKQISNHNEKFKIERQVTNHFYAVTPYGVAWLFSIIFSNNVHIQSPILSSKYLPGVEGVDKEEVAKYQIDHATGEWEGNKYRLASLHLTSIRDFGGLFKANKGKTEKKSNFGEKFGAAPIGINSPQNFMRLCLTQEQLKTCVHLTHGLGIGSDLYSPKLKTQFSTNIPPEDFEDICDTLNVKLKHEHHILDLSQFPDQGIDEAILIMCRIGAIQDHYHTSDMRRRLTATQLGTEIIIEPDPLFNPQIVFNHQNNDCIPQDAYFACEYRQVRLTERAMATPNGVYPLTFFDNRNVPFFGLTVPTISQDYLDSFVLDIAELGMGQANQPYAFLYEKENSGAISEKFGESCGFVMENGIQHEIRRVKINDLVLWRKSWEGNANQYEISGGSIKHGEALSNRKKKKYKEIVANYLAENFLNSSQNLPPTSNDLPIPKKSPSR